MPQARANPNEGVRVESHELGDIRLESDVTHVKSELPSTNNAALTNESRQAATEDGSPMSPQEKALLDGNKRAREGKEEPAETPGSNKEEISLEDFDAEMGGARKLADKAKPKEDVQPPVKEKQTEKPNPKEEPVAGEQDAEVPSGDAEQQKQHLQSQADYYEGFEPHEIQFFRKMSRDSREYVMARMKEGKQLKSQLAEKEALITQLSSGKEVLPPSYYAHKEGYLLSQEYRALNDKVNVTDGILRHWEEQLVKLESGEDAVGLARDREGNIIPHGVISADARGKVQVQRNLAAAQAQYSKFQGQLDNYTQEFEKQNALRTTTLKQAEEQYFASFSDPKYPGHALAKVVMDKLKPLGLDADPLASLLSKASAQNTLLWNEVKTLRAQLAAKEGVREDTRKAPPTISALGGGAPTGGTKPKAPTLSTDDFAKEGVSI